MSKQELTQKLINILKDSGTDNKVMQQVISPHKSTLEKENFSMLINSLKNSIGKYKKLTETSISGVFNKIVVSIVVVPDNSENYIDKLIIKPITPAINSVEDFNRAVDEIDGVDIVSSATSNEISLTNLNDKRIMAIASLVKMIVASEVYWLLDLGKINLNTSIKIHDEDISLLSVGLNEKNIGQFITVKELLSRMLLASDNTAMDVLVHLLNDYGQEYILKQLDLNVSEVLETKKVYSSAWNINRQNQYEKMGNFNRKIVWTNNGDYYSTMSNLRRATYFLKKQSWNPWKDLPDGNLIYKGGSAPGVLSAVWTNTDSQNNDALFIFIANKQSEITFVESTYIYACADKVLRLLNIL